MKRILITGATGNIGLALLAALAEAGALNQVVAGVRPPERAPALAPFPELTTVPFDFESPATFEPALAGVDTVFLLRPPHISAVKAVFGPLMAAMQAAGVKHVMFLSVQGAERSRIIPHHKIEALIRAAGFRYLFLRPSYFMQNLTTTLRDDIARGEIVLPAAGALFNWIDVADIGAVAARLLPDFGVYANQAIELTGEENLGFPEVVDLVRELTGTGLRYRPVSPWRYYWHKRGQGLGRGQVLVLLVLHYLPRWQSAPRRSPHVAQLLGRAPTSLRAFVVRERAALGAGAAQK